MWRTLAAAPASERLAAWEDIGTQVESPGGCGCVGAIRHGGAGYCTTLMTDGLVWAWHGRDGGRNGYTNCMV